jgi:hypothetical protein
MEPGDTMSREEIAERLNKAMIANDLSIKEVAFIAQRSINTIQRVRHPGYGGYCCDVSERTLVRIKTILSAPPLLVKVDMA